MSGQQFNVGDRIEFRNLEGRTPGTVRMVKPFDRYEIEWDDGFRDDADVDYSETELRPLVKASA